MDLRKAFNLVDTDVLLKKLVCDEHSVSWFKSYLQNRRQFVKFKTKISDKKPVTHGVPQRSILGPSLFIMFMNDIPLHVNSSFDMYTDDYTIGATRRTVNIEHKLNPDMEKVDIWYESNRMSTNCDTTKVMLITNNLQKKK